MTRDRAIQVMDDLVKDGYHVALHAHPVGTHRSEPDYHVEVTELSLDGIDLRSLVATAERLEMGIGTHRLRQGVLSFYDLPDPTRAALAKPRQHPR